MIEENKQADKKGRDSKFGSNGWVFDKLFTKAGKYDKEKHKENSAQLIRKDDPDYKQASKESYELSNVENVKSLTTHNKQLLKDISAIVTEINKKLNKEVTKKGIDQYDLQGIFKQMFELYDLTNFGETTIVENNKTSKYGIKTSQILKLLDYLMK